MGTKRRQLLARLSEDERASLVKLSRCSCQNQSIPAEHAELFLRLGLAEMTCGGIGPTSAGRRVMSLLLETPARLAAE